MNKAFLVLLSEKGMGKFCEIFGNEDVIFIEASAVNNEAGTFSFLVLPPVENLQGEGSLEEIKGSSECEPANEDLI